MSAKNTRSKSRRGVSSPPPFLSALVTLQSVNSSVAKALQHQCRSNRLGNVMCLFQLDGAESVHFYTIFQFREIFTIGNMSLRTHNNTSAKIRKISPLIKKGNAAVSRNPEIFLKFFGENFEEKICVKLRPIPFSDHFKSVRIADIGKRVFELCEKVGRSVGRWTGRVRTNWHFHRTCC